MAKTKTDKKLAKLKTKKNAEGAMANKPVTEFILFKKI